MTMIFNHSLIDRVNPLIYYCTTNSTCSKCTA